MALSGAFSSPIIHAIVSAVCQLIYSLFYGSLEDNSVVFHWTCSKYMSGFFRCCILQFPAAILISVKCFGFILVPEMVCFHAGLNC